MNKPALAALLVLLLIVGSVLAFLNSEEPEPVAATPLAIYFTCDTHGRLEPCGCFSGQLGGLTRTDTWLDHHRTPDSLLLDVGGSLGGIEDYHIIQYRYILQAYAKMGYQALNLGAAEARLPADTLREASSGSSVPLLSASLIDSITREPLANPSHILTLGSQKIGLLGVVSPRAVARPGDGVTILSLDDAISRHLPKLREQCEVIILLAFATESEMRQLAKEYYEFSLILGGNVKQPSQNITRENQSILLFTTNQARTVGQVTLTHRNGRVEADNFDIHMLYPKVAQSEEIAALSKQFRTYIRDTTLSIDHPDRLDENAIPGVTPTATYVGTQACASCHSEEFATWKMSGHAHAFDALVRRESEADPTCIGCHTVGFGTSSGYRRSYQGEQLVDVGCESCHGPGSEHVALWKAGKAPNFKFRPLGPGDCKTCHHGEFSRPFDWSKSWPKIAHGKKTVH